MGETITYDAATDTVSAEGNLTADEQDSLQVGEQMIAEQEGLLAGKYKSPQDLEKAYLELQKKQGEESGLGKLDKDTSEETVESDQLDPASFYSEDGSVNYETATEVYGDQVTKQFKDNGIDPFKMNEYFVENNGTLSDEMYADVSNAGFNIAMVD